MDEKGFQQRRDLQLFEQVSDWSPDEPRPASFGAICHSSVLSQRGGNCIYKHSQTFILAKEHQMGGARFISDYINFIIR